MTWFLSDAARARSMRDAAADGRASKALADSADILAAAGDGAAGIRREGKAGR